ncbi:molybdate ABC transporter substrate-binding protein [Alcanivorax sp. 1008]|uniref:molybdate ABC transporter substrate-binding protein n=1 Tax=Alcanivorax sp. 1008 TaxID=2816853 RepID=UPI001D451015|nr:molybdate ABC transporter substrate-binding protein [Alcanivorax sp. 1008]MCC1495349.1 molybdate ABC transporter substrate-binding protein [Alcanivorax sp. 1008]
MTGSSWLWGALLLVAQTATAVTQVTVAVASNFTQAAREIAEAFEQETGHQVLFSVSSSGKLYAQISHGAPFDIFLSADIERPALLESNGLVAPESRRTYATGRLVLWSVDERYQDKDCEAELRAKNFAKLAIANPKAAPYGVAAEEVLASIGLDKNQLTERIVTGESIAQALHFVASGSASMGLIAAAQLNLPDIPEGTCHWQVPQALHSKIEQQVVLLTRSANNPAAKAFMAFLASEKAQAIILAHGYGIE